MGATLVSQVKGLQRPAPIIRHHHEHLDGNGYPDGLAGEDIPLEARILAVADAFDAMTHERSYRQGMSTEQALAQLDLVAGTQHDPVVVEALHALVDRQGEDLIARARAASESGQAAQSESVVRA